MPTHHALIHLTGVVNDIDYLAASTRTLAALGITESDSASLRRRFAAN